MKIGNKSRDEGVRAKSKERRHKVGKHSIKERKKDREHSKWGEKERECERERAETRERI